MAENIRDLGPRLQKKLKQSSFLSSGFPQDDAAEIAVSTVKEWLTDKQALVDRIIFCVFLESDHKIYKEKMLHHFPIDEEDMHENSPSTMKYRSNELSEKSDDKIEGMMIYL
ncbi:ADP-ribose glycohydrolase MACROD2-like [Rhincodon typus]|uniref:ADP-ribose glycohydrolase MACROD2-like n=1 Tax=Rhincodon typus TaxID=259920 RepID=UPI00203040FD|nr:ADP-ribose glycohydrolase MACROD2-like [Rhincodon typus]